MEFQQLRKIDFITWSKIDHEMKIAEIKLLQLEK